MISPIKCNLDGVPCSGSRVGGQRQIVLLDGVRRLDARVESARPISKPFIEFRDLGRAFEAVATASLSAVAFVLPSASITYEDLRAASWVVRDRLLSDPHFRAGDRVVLRLPNSPEYVAGFYGVLLAGGVVVPIPPDAESSRVEFICDACETQFLLTSKAVQRRRPIATITAPETLSLAASEPSSGTLFTEEAMPPDGSAPAAIFFTSGSTGEPKGVTLSHTNLLANAASIQGYLGIAQDDRALGVLPFYHAFGNSVLQSHLLAGATIVLDGSLMFPETLLEAINEHQVTSLSGVPDLFRTLLSRTSFGETELPSLRYLAVAGGRLDPDQASVLAFRAAPAELFIMYGQTEATARLSYLPPELLEERFGSIGKGMPGCELEVVDDAGEKVRPGVTGEIRARGPNIMLGYWNDPVSTAAVLHDGWLYTGDLATVDTDGFIYPQGRRSGLVKIAGFRVHPSEIEDFIRRELPVLETVAIAFEAGSLGTRFALFVQPWAKGESITPESVKSLCARCLPRHKLPEFVEVVDRFPLNDAYKVDRVALRRRAEAAFAAPVESE